jgi:hypothetical protein
MMKLDMKIYKNIEDWKKEWTDEKQKLLLIFFVMCS